MFNIDRLIIEFDKGLRTVFAPASTKRPIPTGDNHDLPDLSTRQQRHVAGLMRINHCGEVCAQALYQGQALTARDPAIKTALTEAAWEETEHLAWTESRLAELGSHKSVLNPLWYGSSLAIGITAGLLGDRWNLGFLAATEDQVGSHLQNHLQQLPPQDHKSRAILQQMAIDEAGHATLARQHGAAELPLPVKAAMRLMSKIMTRTVYYV